MQAVWFTLSLALLCLDAGRAVDYCNISDCSGRPHIACNTKREFNKNCLENREMIKMKQYQGMLLGLHNKYRNMLAGEQMVELPGARSLSELAWDDELELMAETYVNQCREKVVGLCMATSRFPSPAVNYGTTIPFKGSVTNRQLIKYIALSWLNQLKDLKYQDIYRFEENVKLREIAPLIYQGTTHMGCSAARLYDSRAYFFVMACLYNENPTNHHSELNSLYTIGRFNANICQYGVSKKYQFLCKTLP